MSDHTRRDVLKVSGALLGGIAVGSQVTAAASSETFLVDTKGVKYDHPDLQVVQEIPQIDLAVVEGPESAVESVGADYAPDTAYELDLPVDPKVEDESASDEPYYPIQWDKQVQNIPEVHAETRGEETRVAVIDTGVAAGHPDLAHAVNEDLSRDFTGDGYGAGKPYGGYHGTHVAGIVAANDQNDAGVVGSAPGTEIVDCRVFSPSAPASFGAILGAMVYSAAIGCDVANLSLGAYPVPRQGLGSFYGKMIQRTTAYVRRQGTVLVVAAGNDAADLQHDGSVISIPNEASNVMSISATGPIGFGSGDPGVEQPPSTPAVYTNYGTNAIDVSAPGGNYDPDVPAGWYYDLVFNTIALPQFDDDGNYLGAENTYSWLAGTSMAAPQVAGAAALVRSVAPDMNANKVMNTLRRTASDDYTGDKRYHGKGFLNPLEAVNDAAGKGGGNGRGNGRGN